MNCLSHNCLKEFSVVMSPNSYFTIFQPIGTHSKMLKVEYFSVAKLVKMKYLVKKLVNFHEILEKGAPFTTNINNFFFMFFANFSSFPKYIFQCLNIHQFIFETDKFIFSNFIKVFILPKRPKPENHSQISIFSLCNLQ